MLRGEHCLGGAWVPSHGEPFHGMDPRSGEVLQPAFADASVDELDRACRAAATAQADYQRASPRVRAAFLRAIGEEILALGDGLLERTAAETGLPPARLQSERGRTIWQLEHCAQVIEEGSWVEARIDRALPQRTPLPRPDLRCMLVPLGPVAVFGASNFPYAYSVAGGDTASALAAGCAVVVKAHPAHPGTSELVGRAVHAAVLRCGVPAGVFSLVHGRSNRIGAALVEHPAIAAVGFTGSHQGGRSLFDLASRRPHPIPVYAEMGSVNPVFVLPGAAVARGSAIAEKLAASAMMAAGQFCTSPGVMVLPGGEAGEAIARDLARRMAAADQGTMVHCSLAQAHARRLADVCAVQGVEVLASAAAPATAAGVGALVLRCPLSTWLANESVRHEIFGPATVVLHCATADDYAAVARSLDGQLTATVHADPADEALAGGLLDLLALRAGRLVWNGVPTGVEVTHAMVHGGPWPASSEPRTTSVGSAALGRWVRPVAWQDVPQALLPQELRDGNPRGIWRRVEGALSRD